ncbi:IS66 family transposase [Xenorhabdus kozodoii]|uniref:Aspartate aminotransferase family protein n=1 Tax=Xenorhabdus kozodoii TaxID=351676 RepID=A0A2D0LG10_9GAMM|nr:transposase [Xenorhabdus kozodoii]PHM74565.1 aspartate aminotransferase family protein [Xenorhabdus kozodoii]
MGKQDPIRDASLSAVKIANEISYSYVNEVRNQLYVLPYILKHEAELCAFLRHKDIPSTNNEAEQCLRDSVIMRKICFRTNFYLGE